MPESSSTESEAQRAVLAQALFAPRRIALIGASSDPTRLASRPQRVLRQHGYDGTIVAIHPTQVEIDGVRAYPSVRTVPGEVDHAFVIVPASAVPEVIADCCASGVKVATILAAGFAEAGMRGKQRQDEMVAMARASGLRLLGPNCLGVVNVSGRVTISANAVLEREELKPGGLSVISQSGSMLGGIITRAQERGLGFSKLISVGNECDLAVGELTHLLVDDPDTRAILLFLETFRDADVLGAAARRAYDAGKPVIALKLGRSAIGREVATTHTGAMAGADEAADAFFRTHGILRVEVFEALIETAQFVLGHRPPRGRRVGALTVSGGAAGLVLDRLGLESIEVVSPGAEAVARLAARRIRISDTPLIDLPMGRADGGSYAHILDELLASDRSDVVIAIQGSNATYTPDSVRERILAAKRGNKPLAVFLGPRANEALRILQDNGVAGFRTPEACADAVRAYLDWRAPESAVEIDTGRVAAIRAAVKRAGHGVLNEHASSNLLDAIGIPFTRSQIIKHPTDRVDLPFPVAAKILSADLPHKTDAGGVVLDLADAPALAVCVTEMLARVAREQPQSRIDGVLVQSMQRGMAEVIVGYRRHRDVGPVILVGAGGILAEIGASYALRLAPVSLDTAHAMIASVPALATIRGYRNRVPGDLAGLARVVQAMSLLAFTGDVVEAEINPLIVRTDGVVAVDALVRIEQTTGGPQS